MKEITMYINLIYNHPINVRGLLISDAQQLFLLGRIYYMQEKRL